MAITKQIIFKGDATDAVNAADQVADSFKKVDKEAGKANKQIEDVTSNGGAIAILDRLTGGLASQFRDAFEATKLFNGSLKATRGALIATGIGALVVALGTIVAYWDEIVDFITQANKKLEEQKVLLKSNEDLLSAQIERIRAEEDLREIRGQSIDDLILKEKELLKRRIANRKEVVKTREEELKLAVQRFNEITAGEKFLQFFGVDARSKEDLQAIKELRAAAAEARKELAEAEKELLELEDRTAVVINGKDKEGGKTEKTDNEVPLSFDYQSEQDKVQTYYDWYINYLKEKEAELQEVRDSAANGMQELADLSEKLTDEEIARYKREREEKEAEERGKMAITQASLDASTTAFGILGMLAAENKELQIASIIGENATGIAKNIINTNAANARLTLEGGLAAPGLIAANNIRMATGIAASVAATVRALSELGGGGDATAGGLGTGGGGAAAPSFNLVRGTGENQLLEGITRQQDPIEAYVVSDRVTSSAALNRNRASEASLG